MNIILKQEDICVSGPESVGKGVGQDVDRDKDTDVNVRMQVCVRTNHVRTTNNNTCTCMCVCTWKCFPQANGAVFGSGRVRKPVRVVPG